MICYYHPDREAVGTCPGCGKNLCKDCFDLTTGHYCYDCARNVHDNAKAEIKGSLIWCSIILAATLIFALMVSLPKFFEGQIYVGGGLYLFACFVPAWKILGKIADRLLGERVYVGLMLLLAFITKVILAIFLSFVVPVIYLISLFINIHHYKVIKKDMDAIEAMHQNIVAN